MRFAHTNIVAGDWQRLARFYQEVYACEFVPPRRERAGDWLSRGTGVEDACLRGAHLRLPGHGDNDPTLEIYQYAHAEERLPPAANRLGLGHLAFDVSDVAVGREYDSIPSGPWKL